MQSPLPPGVIISLGIMYKTILKAIQNKGYIHHDNKHQTFLDENLAKKFLESNKLSFFYNLNNQIKEIKYRIFF